MLFFFEGHQYLLKAFQCLLSLPWQNMRQSRKFMAHITLYQPIYQNASFYFEVATANRITVVKIAAEIFTLSCKNQKKKYFETGETNSKHERYSHIVSKNTCHKNNWVARNEDEGQQKHQR